MVDNTDVLPICITAGALDEGVPSRDLWVSPNHSMHFDRVLILARHLVNGVTIFQARKVDAVEYFHIELDSHDIVIANGAFSESYLNDDNRTSFHNAHEYDILYPRELPAKAPRWCAPRHDGGMEVERVREIIARRAGSISPSGATSASVLHGYVDEIRSDLISGWAQHIAEPERPVSLEIRAAGKMIGQVLANHFRSDLRQAKLGSGRHAFEFVPPDAFVFSPGAVEVRALNSVALPHSTELKQRLARVA